MPYLYLIQQCGDIYKNNNIYKAGKAKDFEKRIFNERYRNSKRIIIRYVNSSDDAEKELHSEFKKVFELAKSRINGEFGVEDYIILDLKRAIEIFNNVCDKYLDLDENVNEDENKNVNEKLDKIEDITKNEYKNKIIYKYENNYNDLLPSNIKIKKYERFNDYYIDFNNLKKFNISEYSDRKLAKGDFKDIYDLLVSSYNGNYEILGQIISDYNVIVYLYNNIPKCSCDEYYYLSKGINMDKYNLLLEHYNVKPVILKDVFPYYRNFIIIVEPLLENNNYGKFIDKCITLYLACKSLYDHTINMCLSSINFNECLNYLSNNIYILNTTEYLMKVSHQDKLVKYNNHDYMYINYNNNNEKIDNSFYDNISQYCEIINITAKSKPKYYILDNKEYMFPKGKSYLMNPLIYYRLLGFNVHASNCFDNYFNCLLIPKYEQYKNIHFITIPNDDEKEIPKYRQYNYLNCINYESDLSKLNEEQLKYIEEMNKNNIIGEFY